MFCKSTLGFAFPSHFYGSPLPVNELIRTLNQIDGQVGAVIMVKRLNSDLSMGLYWSRRSTWNRKDISVLLYNEFMGNRDEPNVCILASTVGAIV